MSLPAGWECLPGPSHLLDVLFNDIVAGYTVVLGLPMEIPKGAFSVEIAERVYARRLGALVVYRDQDIERYAPCELFFQKILVLRDRADAILLDVRGESARAGEWLEYFGDTPDFSDWPRGLIVMSEDCMIHVADRKGMRSRSWCDFVGRLDCRVLLQAHDRDLDLTVECRLLRESLVVELSDGDLTIAHSLIGLPLQRLMDQSAFDRDRIWVAQVSVLFPIIDRERRRILEKYRDLWVIPYRASNARIVSEIMDLEIRDMVAQAEGNFVMGREMRLLRWLRRVRNLIAHMRVVGWGTLVSSDANGVVNFRDS